MPKSRQNYSREGAQRTETISFLHTIFLDCIKSLSNTLGSEINVGSGINVGVGTFGRNNKRRVWNDSRGRKNSLHIKVLTKVMNFLCSKELMILPYLFKY